MPRGPHNPYAMQGDGGKTEGTCTPLVQASSRYGRHSSLSSSPHRCLHSCRPAPAAATPPPSSPAQECKERGAAGLPPTPPAPHGPRPPRSQPHPSQQPHPTSRCLEIRVLRSCKISFPVNEASKPRVVGTLLCLVKGWAHPAAFAWRAEMSSVSSLAHSQLSPYLEKLDTLEMSKPRSNHLASRLLAAPSHTAPEQKSPWDPSSNKPHWL